MRRERRAELMGAVETALHILNGPEQHGDGSRRKHTYSPSDFLEGEGRDDGRRSLLEATGPNVIGECVCPRVDTHRAGQGNRV